MARKSIADMIEEPEEPLEAPSKLVDRRTPAPVSTTSDLAAIPDPHKPAGTGPLTAEESADLKIYKEGVHNLRRAFWIAGKSLQGIRDRGLYRRTHDSFESFVSDEFEISRPQAYRLMEAWPLAEILSPMGDINERQVRVLLPVAQAHGMDAAATVYKAVAGAEVKVTAAVLADVVTVLPDGEFDPAEATARIRAHLAGEAPSTTVAVPDPDPAEAFAADVHRVRVTLRRAFHREDLHAVAAKRPEEARELAAELRELAAQLDPDA